MTKNKYMYWILSAVIAALLVFSIFQYSKMQSLKINIENNYNRAFHELVNYVDDIDTLLQKSMLVSSATQISTISSELFRQTTAAKACLGQLPISEVQLENTEKFLSQIGDFTYMLSQNSINNKDINEEEYKTLEKLSGYAQQLNSNLVKMQQDIYDGNINFATIKEKSANYLDNSASAKGGDIISGFEEVEKEFHEYPSLIYDGPFSEHIQNLKPALLEGKESINSDKGLEIARNFLGDRGQNLVFSGESENTPIPAYSYSSKYEDREIYISISKKGGYPVYFIDTKTPGPVALDFSQAIQKAKEFLTQKGYTSLTESYYEKSDGIATINFAYTQSDIICYSDLIKVKVSLDDGEIVGMEAHGYIMNNRHRDFQEIKISKDEAIKLINPHLSVSYSGLCLIPKDSKKEVLCYEFKGNHNGKNFLIYINTENGYEEQILMLIESEDGILTV